MWFGKAVQDFNTSVAAQNQLVAQTSNAFTSTLPLVHSYFLPLTSIMILVVWVAYAFYAIPIIVSLAKLNIKPAKS